MANKSGIVTASHTSTSKALGSLAPKNKQKPGGDPGPGGKINSANLHGVSGTNLMTGSSSYRGKGGHK